MIDLAPRHLETIQRILAQYAPDREVRAFGSRVNGNTKSYSDLDLAVAGPRALDPDILRRLKEAFEESDLPIRVDILDWNEISEGFKKAIEAQYEVLQQAHPCVSSPPDSPEI